MSWTTVVSGKNGFRFDRLMIRVMSSSWWVGAMSNWIGCIKQNPLMIWHMWSPLDDLEILEQQIPCDKEMMLMAECWKVDFAILQQYRCLMNKVTAEWTMMIRRRWAALMMSNISFDDLAHVQTSWLLEDSWRYNFRCLSRDWDYCSSVEQQ